MRLENQPIIVPRHSKSHRQRLFKGIAVSLSCLCWLANVYAADNVNWPQFRGPHTSGVSEDVVPTTWNVETGENILWQTTVPGLGHACPIIWGDRIYVATVVKPGTKADLKLGLYGNISSYTEKEKHQWRLLSIDKRSGKIVWDKLAWEAVPRSERHTKASHCNSTPATDGKRIVAFFSSEGLFCFDMDGKEQWRKDFGILDAGFYAVTNTSWGFSSSPILHENKVLIQCDVLRTQFVAALDVKDGHELWRTPRADAPTWSTPVVSVYGGRTQMIVNGWKEIAGYDVANGQELWNLKEGGDIPVASPVLAKDVVILTSGHGKYRPMRAVRLDAKGDITPPSIDATNGAVVWCHPRKGNYLETPIVVGDHVWSDIDGIVSCFDVKSGNMEYEERIAGGGQAFTASPVAAHGNMYFTGEQGDVFVVPATTNFNVVATNKLGGLCLSTPAISEGAMYFRTVEKLVAVGFKK